MGGGCFNLKEYQGIGEYRSLFLVWWLCALVAETIQASSREDRLLKNAAVFEKNVLRFNHFFRKLAKMRYGHIFYYHPVYSESTVHSVHWMVSSIIYTTFYQRYQNMFRDRLQNTPNQVTDSWLGNPFVSVNGVQYRYGQVPRPLSYMIGFFDGPIRIGMTLLTTNRIAEPAYFGDDLSGLL